MLRNSKQLLQIIESAYEASAADGMRLMSLQVRDGQKSMLDRLANYNGISTAAVVRTIIDEWAESQLKK